MDIYAIGKKIWGKNRVTYNKAREIFYAQGGKKILLCISLALHSFLVPIYNNICKKEIKKLKRIIMFMTLIQ